MLWTLPCATLFHLHMFRCWRCTQRLVRWEPRENWSLKREGEGCSSSRSSKRWASCQCCQFAASAANTTSLMPVLPTSLLSVLPIQTSFLGCIKWPIFTVLPSIRRWFFRNKTETEQTLLASWDLGTLWEAAWVTLSWVKLFELLSVANHSTVENLLCHCYSWMNFSWNCLALFTRPAKLPPGPQGCLTQERRLVLY